jgi:hypothetical protein
VNPALDCEAAHRGHERVSTVIVQRADGTATAAAGYGPVIVAICRAELEQRGVL